MRREVKKRYNIVEWNYSNPRKHNAKSYGYGDFVYDKNKKRNNVIVTENGMNSNNILRFTSGYQVFTVKSLSVIL